MGNLYEIATDNQQINWLRERTDGLCLDVSHLRDDRDILLRKINDLTQRLEALEKAQQ